MSAGRVLMAVIDAGGTLPPAMGVAAELVRRGHEVSVLGDPTAEASARAAGCAFLPWRSAPHVDSVAEQTALIAALEHGSPLRQLASVKERIFFGPADRFARDVLDAVELHRPGVLAVEAAIPGILIGAEASGLPTAALMPNIYLRPTPGLPLMGTGWRPPAGALGRARDALAMRALRRVWVGSLPQLNATRAAFGLSAVGDLFEPFDRCDRVLVLTSPSFDFAAPALPPNVRYVGPQLDDPDWAVAPGAAWRPPGEAPLVLVALSSVYQDQLSTLRRISAALASLPVRAVVTTGRAVDPAAVPASPRVVVVRAAPHRHILTEAAAVVTHAGHGSVLKSLNAGVPLVCLPMGRDQRDNTVRAVRLGAALRVAKNARPGRIAGAVHEVLDRPDYGAAARRFANVLATEARTRPNAADEVEGLLAR